MATRLIALVAALLLYVAACSPATTRMLAVSATPTETASPQVDTNPPPTAPPTLTPKAVTWAPLENSPDLARDPSWACTGGVQIDGDRLVLQAGGDYLTIANSRGPQLAFEGDFGIVVTLEVPKGERGAFVLFGALPQGAWWQGIKRLDLYWNGEQLDVHLWDGARQQPRETLSFAAQNRSDKARTGCADRIASLCSW